MTIESSVSRLGDILVQSSAEEAHAKADEARQIFELPLSRALSSALLRSSSNFSHSPQIGFLESREPLAQPDRSPTWRYVVGLALLE